MNFSQINFGVFALKIYGIFLSLAFALGSWHYYRALEQHNFSKDFFLHHYWRWLLGGILLGRLVAVILNVGAFDQYGIFTYAAFWEGELNFFGVLTGFLLTMYIDLKRHNKPFYKWIDVGMPSFLLAVLVVDLAGFLTGRVYGTETILPWGVQYETFGVEILNPVHPVTLYGFICHFFLLQWVRKNFNSFSKIPGKLFYQTLLYFFLIDFVLQFWRGGEPSVFFGFKLAQIFDLMAIMFLLYASFFQSFIWERKQKTQGS